MPLPPLSLAIQNVTLIDGTGAPPRPRTTVLIAAKRIVAVGPEAAIPIPPGTETLDATGRWLIPGLTDMHVHVNLCGEEAFPLWLANGVTSIRDIGGNVPAQVPWRAELAAGTRPGPRLFIYGPMIDGAPSTFAGEPGGTFEQLWSEVDSPEAGIAEIDRLLAEGVDGFKFYQNLPVHSLRPMLAHVGGRVPVTGHLCATFASDAIRARIACLEHNMLTPFNDVCRPEDRTPPGWTMRTPGFWAKVHEGWARANLAAPHARAFIELLAAAGTAYDPTASLGTNGLALEETDEESGQAHITPALRATRERNAARARAAGAPPPQPDPALLRASAERQMEMITRVHEAGGVVVAGTDTGAVQPLIPGFSLHRELRWLVRAGLTPLEAITAATGRAAAVLRRADDQGTVRPGRRADLVVLDADPLADIRNTRRIHRVVKDGRLYDPAALLAT